MVGPIRTSGRRQLISMPAINNLLHGDIYSRCCAHAIIVTARCTVSIVQHARDNRHKRGAIKRRFPIASLNKIINSSFLVVGRPPNPFDGHLHRRARYTGRQIRKQRSFIRPTISSILLPQRGSNPTAEYRRFALTFKRFEKGVAYNNFWQICEVCVG